MPLLEETGAALADYILRARPKVDSQYLFLSFTPPVGPFKCAAPVSRIVRKRLRHGGVELGRVAGAHLLRHSLATQLVGQRRPINEVADLLGHRSINTTALYVKVSTSCRISARIHVASVTSTIMRLGKAPHAPCLPIAQTIPVRVDMRRPLKKCPPLQLRHSSPQRPIREETRRRADDCRSHMTLSVAFVGPSTQIVPQACGQFPDLTI
nr:tyrosine-type recombinase/integrase [Sinorhizobium meliloti]